MKAEIWKYQLEITDQNTISVPRHAILLKAETQNHKPCLWFMVIPDAPKEDITINILGTGHPFETTTVGEYIGTALTHNGTYVWHLFRKTYPGEGRTTMKTYYITFGQKSPFRDGWVEIVAESLEEAQCCASYSLGHWLNCYTKEQFDQFDQVYYPAGKLGHTLNAK